MRGCPGSALVLLACFSVSAEALPADWKLVKDSKDLCQLAVPSDWVSLPDTIGAAILHDPATAIAVVTSQPEQTFQPLTEVLRKLIRIPQDRMFENSAKRLFTRTRCLAIRTIKIRTALASRATAALAVVTSRFSRQFQRKLRK